ncbi:DUF6396 domain-containing protein [Acinetobacter sichuanensis]|uniref:DUF6396 domain-containing protein n=1 Tax=Acinetobacter sichuanensis TaxID=2136183 RepID=UPI00280DF847|nr:DUF6396 domain-containing protein [Acinetobacter sichuanensis]MDQ9022385.1 DUF6396 domain-containing protein [Acinetobacter sichuanensis]
MNKKTGITVVVLTIVTLLVWRCKHYIDCELQLSSGTSTSQPSYCLSSKKLVQQRLKIEREQQEKNELIEFSQNFKRDEKFICKREPIQKQSMDNHPAQALYDYAIWQRWHTPKDQQNAYWALQIARYQRIAAAHGIAQANEWVKQDTNLDLQQEDIKFLKTAAWLGSGKAQFKLAENIDMIKDADSKKYRDELYWNLINCAAKNEVAKAYLIQGEYWEAQKNFQRAVMSYREAVKQGDVDAARNLYLLAERQLEQSQHKSIEQERVRRYEYIFDYLESNRDLPVTVKELDEIVPLTSAQLPIWNGKIAFQHWYESPSPAQPDPRLLEALAKSKGLNPRTGLPDTRFKFFWEN